jgi:flagellar biosynthesis protein FlhA
MQICQQYAGENRTLHVLTLESSLEQSIVDSKAKISSGEIMAVLEPALHNAWIESLEKSIKAAHIQGVKPVILCSVLARYLVKTALEKDFPEVAVLSVDEIARDYKVESLGVIALEQGDKCPKKQGDSHAGH